jgi:putative peptidoglycan lipid II flippase
VAGPAGKVSLATVCSRIAGLLRESVFAALFGRGGLSDAFVFAFRIPNLLRDFFAEGALSSAFVPTFAHVKAKEGDGPAFLLARRVLGTLATVAGIVALLGIVFAPAIVSVVAWDAPEEHRPLTVLLTRVMFPFLVLVAMAAVAMGILNTCRRYFLPALAPAFFNLVSVAGGLVLLLLPVSTEDALVAWSVLVVLGGAAQFLVQVPSLRAVGMRGPPVVDLGFRDPHLRAVVRRMGPVVIGLAGTNVMIVVTTILASREVGWASTLQYAFRLVHLPIGLVGVAIGTVLLAAGARRQAAGDGAGVDDLVRRGLRLNWFLALPAAVGLFVLAEPLIRVIYEHGEFGPAATRDAALALRWYAGGIAFYAGVKAAAPLFLVRGDTRTPMLCSLAGLGANLAVAFATIDALGFRALALAVVGGTAVNYGFLRLLGRLRFGPASGPGWGFLARCGVAAAAMGGVGYAVAETWLRGDAAPTSSLALGLLVLGLSAALAGLYLALASALRLEEAGWLTSRLSRRKPD